MTKDVILPLLARVIPYAIYVGFHAVFSAVQRFYWHFIGLEDKPDKIRIMNIIYRQKLDPLGQAPNFHDFIAIHDKFEDVDYVLNDKVGLYCLSTTEAMFVEGPKGTDMTKAGAFLVPTQYELSTKVIVMPIEKFHQLAETIKAGEHDRNVILITNTGRCGSTLLSRIFEQIDNCISMSEPSPLSGCLYLRQKMQPHEFDRMIENILQVLCKPIISDPNRNIFVVKTNSHIGHAIPYIKKYFQESKQIFMYREGVNSSRSLGDTYLYGMPWYTLYVVLERYFPLLSDLSVRRRIGFTKALYPLHNGDAHMLTFLEWAMNCNEYQKCYNEYKDLLAVKYEKLIDKPFEQIQKLLSFCELPAEWVEIAIKGIHIDSQKGSQLSRDKMKSKKSANPYSDKTPMLDAICDKYDLPRPPNEVLLVGTML